MEEKSFYNEYEACLASWKIYPSIRKLRFMLANIGTPKILIDSKVSILGSFIGSWIQASPPQNTYLNG